MIMDSSGFYKARLRLWLLFALASHELFQPPILVTHWLSGSFNTVVKGFTWHCLHGTMNSGPHVSLKSLKNITDKKCHKTLYKQLLEPCAEHKLVFKRAKSKRSNGWKRYLMTTHTSNNVTNYTLLGKRLLSSWITPHPNWSSNIFMI